VAQFSSTSPSRMSLRLDPSTCTRWQKMTFILMLIAKRAFFSIPFGLEPSFHAYVADTHWISSLVLSQADASHRTEHRQRNTFPRLNAFPSYFGSAALRIQECERQRLSADGTCLLFERTHKNWKGLPLETLSKNDMWLWHIY